MALELNDIADLKVYLDGVLGRANHHAGKVNKIALALCGGIIWKADKIEVREYNGKPANMLWFDYGEKRFCFLFNHLTGLIEVRDRTSKSNLIRTFSNDDTLDEVKHFFDSL